MDELPNTTLVQIKGNWYVNCTIPEGLREFFPGRKQIRKSTRTADKALAKRRKHGISQKIYDEFAAAKPKLAHERFYELTRYIAVPHEIEDSFLQGEISSTDLRTLEAIVLASQHPGYTGEAEEDHALAMRAVDAADALEVFKDVIGTRLGPSEAPILSEACKEYLATVPFGRGKTQRDVELSIERIIEFLGDLPLDELTAPKLEEFAQDLHDKGAARQTISKRIVYLKGLLDHAVRKGWITLNPLRDYRLSKKHGAKGKTWSKLEEKELTDLFALSLPIHIRTLFTILITTGMRLDEAALLDWSDLKEEGGIPFFDLTGVDKILKTKVSSRKVPVPDALHAVMPKTGRVGPMFPEFLRDKDGKASTSASKALMRYVRKVTDNKSKVVHSLRGSLKDLLRDAGVPKETNDFITGHGSGDVAGQYGSGPSLKVRASALNKIDHPWLNQED